MKLYTDQGPQGLGGVMTYPAGRSGWVCREDACLGGRGCEVVKGLEKVMLRSERKASRKTNKQGG